MTLRRDHLVITVHGIRTFGQWQERLKECLKSEADDIEVYDQKYGYFSIIAFLIPPLRWLATRNFRKQLLRLTTQQEWRRIDIVAHSFGTHLVGHGLTGIPANDRPAIHTVILAGSVLKMNFDWGALIPRHVTRVINECGHRDHVLLMNQLLVLLTGMAGRVGFRGMFNESTFQNRFFDFGHSDYFREEQDGNSFMREKWLPLLLGTDPIIPFPDARPSTSWRGFATFLLNNAEPVKLLLWITPLLLLVQYINNQRAIAVEQQMIATSRLADSLVFLGDAVLGAHDYENAYERYVEADALTTAQSKMRTPEPFRNWASDIAFWDLFREWRPPIQEIETSSRIDLLRVADEARSAVVASGAEIAVWNLITQRKSSDLTRCTTLPEFVTKGGPRWANQVTISEEQSPYWGDIAISPPGDHVAVGDLWGSLAVCGTNTGEVIWSQTDKSNPVSTLNFNEGGDWLAAGFTNGSVRIIEASTGKLLQEFAAHSGPVRSVIVSGDESLIATLGPVDSPSGFQLAEPELRRRYNYVAETDRHVVRFFDAATGAPAGRLDRPELSSSAVVFRDDGKIVSHGPEGTAIWTRAPESGRFGLLNSSAVIRDEASYNQPGLLSPRGSYVREALTGHGMTSVDRQHDSDALTIHRLTFANADEDKRDNGRTLPGAAVRLSTAQFSSDERLLVGVLDSRIVIWDLEDRSNQPEQPRWANYGITTLDFSFDDRLVLAKRDRDSVALYDVGTSRVLQTYPAHDASLTAVELDVRLEMVIVGDEGGTVVAYDLRTGHVRYELQVGPRPRSVEMSEDGSTLMISTEAGLQKWRVPERDLVDQVNCSGNTEVVTLSARGSGFPYICDQSIHIGSDRSSSKSMQIELVDDPTAVALSRNGLMLAWGNGRGIIDLLDIGADELRRSIDRDATGYIGGIGFLVGDEFLVSTGSGDRSLTLWDARSLRPVRKFPILFEGGGPIVVTPTGRRVLTDGAYGQLLFWDFPSSKTLLQHFRRGSGEDALQSLPSAYATLGNCGRAVLVFEENPDTQWVTGTREKMALCYAHLQRGGAARRVFALARSERPGTETFFDLWTEHLDAQRTTAPQTE